MYEYVRNRPVRFKDPLGSFKFYGNWCGPGWSAGHEGKVSEEEWKIVGSIDILDEICKKHDACFQNVDPSTGKKLCKKNWKTKKECNRESCKEIQKIDPTTLEQPPNETMNVYRAYQLLYNFFCYGSQIIF